ncbi:MAG: ribosomal-processing cysteine protease Prp [Candidatus Eremiobacteraeota bacterium]|nr:ribosomal-processing cysteine protease Prp [Candidatus Eremiobacteraeota bacterium]
MLEVTFCRDSRNRLSSLFARGHTDFADRGEDVVCAAVSGILQAARLGLEAHAKVPLEVSQQSGDLRLRWPESVRDDPGVAAIGATAELAVRQIAGQYPAHVLVRDERES